MASDLARGLGNSFAGGALSGALGGTYAQQQQANQFNQLMQQQAALTQQAAFARSIAQQVIRAYPDTRKVEIEAPPKSFHERLRAEIEFWLPTVAGKVTA